jgi:8-oxo-dGTP diphosphatase
MNNSTVKGGDDASDAQWFAVENLPQLAFDHIKAVEMAVSKIDSLK